LIAGSWTSGTFDQDKFGKALLLFRNAPIAGGASPSQIVFNRPTRDLIPAHRRSFAPEWQQVAAHLEKRTRRAKELQVQPGLPLTWQLPCFVAIFTILSGTVAKKIKKPRKFGVILEQKRGKMEKNMAISWLDSKRGRIAMF
jgi:hypothetical protein